MLVDTDVLIDYLKGNSLAVDFIEQNIDQVSVCSITIAELYQGIRNKREKEILDLFVSELRVFSITGDIAIRAGLLRKEYGKSHSSGLADCIIAATAMSHGMKLATLNLKHFPMIDTAFTPYKKS
jgi:predicted nucleic acid-binding protein